MTAGPETLNDGQLNDGRAPLTDTALAALQADDWNSGYYGDTLTPLRLDDNLRIGFLNVNGLQRERWKEKNAALLNFFYRYKFDIINMVETNIFWPLLKHNDRWENRIEGRWENQRSVLAYNVNDSVSSSWQPGGCLQVSVDRVVHRIISCSSDPSRLGRWA